jgi:hypothetical protein
MKVLRTLFVFLITAAVLGYAGYSFYIYSLTPCDQILEYSIGRFDAKFGITKEEFKSYVIDAETVWEEAIVKDLKNKRELFAYNPDAKFKINLIFDERQLATVQKQKTEFGLEAAENILEKLDAEFNKMKIVYDAETKSYEAERKAFEVRQKSYEAAVEYWNREGGAPKKEFEELQREAETLNLEAQRLNGEAAFLNTKAKELNVVLENRNRAALEYNRVAENYNKKFGHGLEFDQAEYVGGGRNEAEINIYQFGNKYDLTLALAHEFGHALQMDHVENPKSIMHYVTSGTPTISLAPSAEDLAELNRVCYTK